MPMPARHLWSQIQKQLRGSSEAEQLRIVRRHLDELHDEWKGPYKDLRDRLRRLVSRLEGHEETRSRAGQKDPFHVKRQGDATIVVAGVPNSGKSALVAALTGAATTIADYPFATQHPVPGMLNGNGAALQLIDTPPVMPGLASGEGPGRPLLHLMSIADALVLALDASTEPEQQLQIIDEELQSHGIVPVRGPVATVLQPRGKGGIRCTGLPVTRDEERAARSLVEEAHFEHAEIAVRTGYDEGQLQQQLDGEKLVPTILAAQPDLQVANEPFPMIRCDLADDGLAASLFGTLLHSIGRMPVHLLERAADDAARSTIWIPLASDVAAAMEKSGRPAGTKGARLWGPSATRPGQSVGLDHALAPEDCLYVA